MHNFIMCLPFPGSSLFYKQMQLLLVINGQTHHNSSHLSVFAPSALCHVVIALGSQKGCQVDSTHT